jgi:putative PIG3 family NAD(P)H quinone oxidoreductase
MLSIAFSRPGPPEVLTPVERPRPEPAAGEVLIRVAAAGVNRPDVLQRLGHYPAPPGASEILGLEVAGTIEALGEEVTGWAPGRPVCALLSGGGYAEYAVVPAGQCLPIPAGLTATEAAALPEAVFTVWTNVFDRGHLKPGETILIHGGASGIGTTAIQLARAMGSHVYATAGTAEKCAACEQLGAERGINYRREDFVDIVKKRTHERGVDMILDMVGGDYVARNLEALAPEGRLVQIAFLKGSAVEIDLRPFMLKRLTLTGSTLRPRTAQQKAAIACAVRAHVWPLIESGAFKPVVHATFPLAEAAAAHRMMEDDVHIGKIVLEM